MAHAQKSRTSRQQSQCLGGRRTWGRGYVPKRQGLILALSPFRLVGQRERPPATP